MFLKRNQNASVMQAFFGGFIGLLIFYFLIGLGVLNPHYVNWLLQANNQDTAQHFVGWEFFRHEAWHFPLGRILNYGAPIGTSIVYTDSIPLFAIFFKCFQLWLPLHFQYFGVWFALCFFLQGFFAWLISDEITDQFFSKLIISCFFLISPIMLNRMIEHQALAAHWVLLAALFLYIKPYTQRSNGYWLLLNVMTLLIHAYLSVMLLPLWLAFLVKNSVILDCMNLRSVMLQIMLNVMSLSIFAWLIGYFILPVSDGLQVGGFIFSSMNVLAPFMPTSGSYLVPDQWSHFIKPLTDITPEQAMEGFNYFGLGMLSLMLIAACYGIKQRAWLAIKNWWPLCVVSVFFLLYAMSNKIYVGTHVLLNYPLPASAIRFSDIFRNAGRFFWPAYYLIMIITFKLIHKLPASKKMMISLLAAAFILQIIDLSPKLNQFIIHFHQASTGKNKMDNAFWQEASKKYRKLAFFPIIPMPNLAIHDFQDYIYYAAIHNMTVNDGYFARYDRIQFEDLSRKLFVQLYNQRHFDSDTLYVLIDRQFLGVMKARLTPKDKVIRLANYVVIAPSWYT